MAPRPRHQDTRELIGRLVAAHFEFVIVGGVAATLHGSGTFTSDLDVVAPITEENAGRLLQALEGLHPFFYQAANARAVIEDARKLAAYKNLYLGTDIGVLDVLGALPPVGTYETVSSRAIETKFFGHVVRLVSLDDLIAVKAHVARPKDKQMELELRAIRDLLKSK